MLSRFEPTPFRLCFAITRLTFTGWQCSSPLFVLLTTSQPSTLCESKSGITKIFHDGLVTEVFSNAETILRNTRVSAFLRKNQKYKLAKQFMSISTITNPKRSMRTPFLKNRLRDYLVLETRRRFKSSLSRPEHGTFAKVQNVRIFPAALFNSIIKVQNQANNQCTQVFHMAIKMNSLRHQRKVLVDCAGGVSAIR